MLFEEGKVDFYTFCLGMYGHTRFQDSVDTFNLELVKKFTREVSYRLDDVREDIGDKEEIPREAMMVFHHHDYSMNIQGDIQGSNVAAGGSTISDSTAAYTNHEELATALKSLKSLINEVSEGQRASVESALQLLVKATQDPSISTKQVAEATRTILASSPTMGEKLKGIAGKVGLSLVSSSIFQGIKIALGL